PLRLVPPPETSLIRAISVSFTLVNVCAAPSARSAISSAISISRSKSASLPSSERSSPTSRSRSSATRSTSFSEAIDPPCVVGVFGTRWVPRRAGVEVQVLVAQLEVLFQLVHALGGLHERRPEPLDLLVGQRARVHPAQRLPLHELAQKLDEGEHELGKPSL